MGNVSNKLKSLRNKMALSQSDIADACGFPREIISYYESEKREVSLLHLEQIASFFNVDLEYFLSDDENFEPEFALAFRADELSSTDRVKVGEFKKVVTNFLKMKSISTDGTEA